MLKGDLVTTPLPAVLRQLADGVASGCLHVDDGVGSVAKVFLRGGLVYAVQVPGRRPQLGARLVSSGALGPEALAEALEAQRTELQGWRLGELLVHLGFVEQTVVEAFVDEQLRESTSDLLRWATGTWKFRVNERTREDVAPPTGVEELLASVEERRAHWDVITEVLHGPDAVPMLSSAGQTDAEMAIDPDAWSLLCKVDGVRSLSALAVECGFTLYEAGQVVYSLVRSGLLEVEEIVGPESTPEPVIAEFPEAVTSKLVAAFGHVESPVEDVVIPAQAEEMSPSDVANLVATALRADRSLEAPPVVHEDDVDASVDRVSQALNALLGDSPSSTDDLFAAPKSRKVSPKPPKPKTASEIERDKRAAARAEASAKRRAADAEELALAQAELEAARAAEAEAAFAELAADHEAEVVSLSDARQAAEERAAAEAAAAEEAARVAAEAAAEAAAAEEAARIAAEEEATRVAAEAAAAEEAARIAAEAARIAAKEEAARQAAEAAAAEEAARIAAEEEAARQAAEAAVAEEAARVAAEAAAAEEAARIAAEEDAARIAAEFEAEAARLAAEEADAARIAAEFEAEAARLAAEEEAARVAAEFEAEAARLAAEEAAAEERARAEAEAAEAEAARLAAEAAAAEEAARIAAEEEAARQAAEAAAAEERARVEEELRAAAEQQAAEEAARLAAEEEARQIAEAQAAARRAAESEERARVEEELRAAAAAEAAESARRAAEAQAAEQARVAAEFQAAEMARQAAEDAEQARLAEQRLSAADAFAELSATAASAGDTLVVEAPVETDEDLLDDEVDNTPLPTYPPADTDMASLFRELSSLGLEDEPAAPAGPVRPAPRPVSPAAGKPKKKGLFGR